jgi:hypothetical protein
LVLILHSGGQLDEKIRGSKISRYFLFSAESVIILKKFEQSKYRRQGNLDDLLKKNLKKLLPFRLKQEMCIPPAYSTVYDIYCGIHA